MSEIVKYEIYKNDAEIFLDDDSIISVTFDLEECYSDHFNPGSLYGHYEKFCGYQPIDLVFDREISTELEDEITEYLQENYDYSKFE